MREIYLVNNIQNSDKQVVVEGDEHSVWVYYCQLTCDKIEILLDGFLCSRGTLLNSTTEVKKYIDQNFAPPLVKIFSTEVSIQKDICEDDIHLIEEDEFIRIYIKDKEFLRLDLLNKMSFSKSVAKEGPYGLPLID